MATCNKTFASLLLTRPHNIDEYPAPWLGCKNHHGNKGDRLQQQWLVLSEAIITREMMWKLQPVYVGKRDCAAQSQSQSSSSECVRVGWRIMSGLLIADLKAANKNSMSDFGLAWLCAQASSFTSNPIEPVAMTSSSAEALVEGLGLLFERLSHLLFPPGSIGTVYCTTTTTPAAAAAATTLPATSKTTRPTSMTTTLTTTRNHQTMMAASTGRRRRQKRF